MRAGKSFIKVVSPLYINDFIYNHTNYNLVIWKFNAKSERLLYDYKWTSGLKIIFHPLHWRI